MDNTIEEMIERHEGCSAVPYVDSLGYQTIGIGHNLQKPLSMQAIKAIFKDDLNETINDCLHAFPWFTELSKYRQWVYLDMCFNLGLAKFQGFKKFHASVERGDYETAATEMLDSLWRKQVKGRALELAALMRGTAEV